VAEEYDRGRRPAAVIRHCPMVSVTPPTPRAVRWREHTERRQGVTIQPTHVPYRAQEGVETFGVVGVVYRRASAGCRGV